MNRYYLHILHGFVADPRYDLRILPCGCCFHSCHIPSTISITVKLITVPEFLFAIGIVSVPIIAAAVWSAAAAPTLTFTVCSAYTTVTSSSRLMALVVVSTIALIPLSLSPKESSPP